MYFSSLNGNGYQANRPITPLRRPANVFGTVRARSITLNNDYVVHDDSLVALDSTLASWVSINMPDLKLAMCEFFAAHGKTRWAAE